MSRSVTSATRIKVQHGGTGLRLVEDPDLKRQCLAHVFGLDHHGSTRGILCEARSLFFVSS